MLTINTVHYITGCPLNKEDTHTHTHLRLGKFLSDHRFINPFAFSEVLVFLISGAL